MTNFFVQVAASCRPILFCSMCLFALKAHSDGIEPSEFEQCKITLHEKALSRGLSEQTTREIISGLEPIERVIQLDRSQPEFTESFAGYIHRRVTDYRVKSGKALLSEHAVLLSRLTKQYGVSARYLVAFWGLETNFGSYKGKIKVLNSLATLACDPRRSDYFTNEFLNLLSLLDAQKVNQSQLLGSWAGAMGHMQFMPTALKQYGMDGDGDGKVDVWNSIPDALTSAANYLNQIGWHEEEIWGRRVYLPDQFAFDQVRFDQDYPLSHFKTLGIKRSYGRTLPNYDTNAQLILPSGHSGPAFLVYNNFKVIMKWNFSQNYALAVGLLADQLVNISNGMEGLSPEPHAFTNEHLKQLQIKLADMGYEVGTPDGIWGPLTRQALQQFQLKSGLVADGFPNAQVFEKLALSLE